jgi:hypothetical protein
MRGLLYNYAIQAGLGRAALRQAALLRRSMKGRLWSHRGLPFAAGALSQRMESWDDFPLVTRSTRDIRRFLT